LNISTFERLSIWTYWTLTSTQPDTHSNTHWVEMYFCLRSFIHSFAPVCAI